MIGSTCLTDSSEKPYCSHRALALAAAASPTEMSKSLKLFAWTTGSSTAVSDGSLLGRQRFIIFQMEFVFPLHLNSSEQTYSFSANLISRLTSCLKNRKAFQWSLSFDLWAYLCQLSWVFINYCLISGVINECGHY